MAIKRKADSKGRITLSNEEAGEEFWVQQLDENRYEVVRRTQKVFLQEPAKAEERKAYYNGLGFPAPLAV